MGEHLIDGSFQSDKYPSCPRGKVPLSEKDPMAQDLLAEYARRRRAVDPVFADDLEQALRNHGYKPSVSAVGGVPKPTSLAPRERAARLWQAIEPWWPVVFIANLLAFLVVYVCTAPLGTPRWTFWGVVLTFSVVLVGPAVILAWRIRTWWAWRRSGARGVWRQVQTLKREGRTYKGSRN